MLSVWGIFFTGFTYWHPIGFFWQIWCVSGILVFLGAMWRAKADVSMPWWIFPIFALAITSCLFLPKDYNRDLLIHGSIQDFFHHGFWVTPVATIYSYIMVVRILTFACLAFLLTRVLGKKLLWMHLLIGCYLSIFLCLLDYLSIINISWLPDNKAYNGIFNTTFPNYNWYVQMIVPSLLGIFLFEKVSKLPLPSKVALLVVQFVFVFSIGSRLAMFAYMVGGVVLVVSWMGSRNQTGTLASNGRWTFLGWGVTLFSGALLFLAIYSGALGDASQKIKNLSQSDRFGHWYNALSVISYSPWQGNGVESYGRVDRVLSGLGKEGSDVRYQRKGYFFKDTPHSQLLAFGIDFGVLGGLVCCLCLFYPIRRIMLSPHPNRLEFLSVYSALLVLILFQELFYIGAVTVFFFTVSISMTDEIQEKNSRFWKGFIWSVVIFYLLGASLSHSSTNGLVTAQEKHYFDASKKNGFGDWESWDGVSTRWVSSFAKERIMVEDNFLKLTFDAHWKNVSSGKRVNVQVLINNEMEWSFSIGRDDVQSSCFDVSALKGKEINVQIMVEEVFQDYAFRLSSNTRVLGVGLRKYEFSYMNPCE